MTGKLCLNRTVLSAIIAIIAVGTGLLLLPRSLSDILISEGGPIETAQFVFYIAGASISWLYAKQKIWRSGLSGGMILLTFALRELDFQKRFSDMSVMKPRFFLSPDVATSTKAIVGVVLIGILAVFLVFIKRNLKGLFNGLKDNKGWAFTAITGVGLLFCTVLLETLVRSMKSLGLYLRTQPFEETIETAIPLLFIIALFQFSSKRNEL